MLAAKPGVPMGLGWVEEEELGSMVDDEVLFPTRPRSSQMFSMERGSYSVLSRRHIEKEADFLFHMAWHSMAKAVEVL